MSWGLLQMGLLAWLLFTALIAVASVLLVPRLRRALRRVEPAQRALALRALLLAPVVGGGLATLLCFLPKTLDGLLPHVDHCAAHADGHVHFCVNHPPEMIGGDVAGGVLLFLVLAAVVLTATRGLRLRSSMRQLQGLLRIARHDARRGVWVVDAPLPVALSVGLRRSRTLLSRGLLETTPAAVVDVVVAHEHAHARRRDGLWKVTTQLLGWAHLPTMARALEADLDLACEQACDEEAAAVVGDRLRVAEALVAVARRRENAPDFAPAALAFGAGSVGARVHSLLAPPSRHRAGRGLSWAALAVAVVAAAALADPLHHWTETFLHYVLG